LSSTFAAASVSRSASSKTMICQRPPAGAIAHSRTSLRAMSTPMLSWSLRTTVTSGCVSPIVVRHSWHCPQPGMLPVHCNAAANERAVRPVPDPGGPVISQACVIAFTLGPVTPRSA